MSTNAQQENTNAENLGNVKILQDRTSVCVTPASKDQNVYKVSSSVCNENYNDNNVNNDKNYNFLDCDLFNKILIFH